MMKNKTIKKTLCIIITMLSLICIFNQTYATTMPILVAEGDSDAKSVDSTTIMNAGKNWISLGKKEAEGKNYTPENFANQFAGIARILVSIGLVTAIIVTAIMAIKWITATPDKQAKLKQQLIGLVVSIIVIFGAVGIWRVVTNILTTVEETI